MHCKPIAYRHWPKMVAIFFCVAVLAWPVFAQPVRTPHATIDLITENSSVASGQDFLAGLYFVLDEGWHIYWINPGDAGLPPRIDWSLPPGVTAGDLQFPAPKRLPLGPLMNFGYDEHVLLPVPMHVAESIHPGTDLTLQGHVSFLICSTVCIPGKADLQHKVPITRHLGPPDRETEPLFHAARGELPRTLPAGESVSIAQTASDFQIMLRAGHSIPSAEFFPFDQNVFAIAAPQKAQPLPDGIRITVPKVPGLTKIPAQVRGLIKLPDGTAYHFQSSVTAAPITRAPLAPHTGADSLGRILGLAFLGGLILNLMPCVFPVLFIKGLSLVQSSAEERKRLRVHGVMYTLGILVSFWIVVAILLLLRSGGSHLGWGFQFQSPYFVAFMALLFFFLGLSLAGQFEIGLSATSVGGELAKRGGYSGSFFTGILATVVATPCTAPFMGAAIGFALSQHAWMTFAVFTLLALGLAAPYLLLTLHPAWTRILPKPGVWMEYVKQAVSIPIFAAVIWMVWVFAQIAGSNGVAALLAGMLVTAIAGWVLGRWPARWPSAITAILLLVLAIVLPSAAAIKFSPPVRSAAKTLGSDAAWQPYSPDRLAEARLQGKSVFVDFSAAWCLSCQVNKRVALDRPEVEAAFRKSGVITMLADWTNQDPEITDALSKLGRSGVPTYALYSGGPDASPDLLPEVLTPGIVLDALNKLPLK